VTTLAIVNPVAGNGSAVRIWQRVRSHAWDCQLTEAVGHARELAETAVRGGYDRVVAIGGDGTVCEVANGLAHTETALGIIPAGTGNDTAQNLGIPRDPFAAATLADTGASHPIDLGVITTAERRMYFMNVAGFGFDAEVAWRVNRLPKLIGGTLPYVIGVLQTLWQYRSPQMRIRADEGPRLVDRRVFLVAVGNCASYGGGMRIVPSARPDDGLFEVCVVSDLRRLEVLRLVPKLYSGGHVGHPAVEMLRCRCVTAEADGRVLCQADGELVGLLPVQLVMAPGALRCVTGRTF
jgi:YegS/Rv2252/BmrU family lipid kinase